MDRVSVEDAVTILNRAYKADPVAMRNLVHNRVICTTEMAEDPTVQVGEVVDGTHEVGMLGIINGIFGADENSLGFIAAIEHEGMLMGFRTIRLPEDNTDEPLPTRNMETKEPR